MIRSFHIIMLAMALAKSSVCFSQQDKGKEFVCMDYPVRSVEASLFVDGVGQVNEIKAEIIIENGIRIGVVDQDISILGFTAMHDCHSGIAPDIRTKNYLGDKIPAGDRFVEGIRKGDQLVFTCITIIKGKKTFVIPSLACNIK